MTHREATAYLSTLVNYEQQTPTANDLALQSIRTLLAALGNPHLRLPVVHVAGTNGKGTVATMLDGILREAGYRTGLYTSPALCSFEERIRISSAPVAPDDWPPHLSRIRDAIAAARFHPHPTYFDVVTALAFVVFDAVRVDVAVVEVGLGGRNDSTNVCAPVLSVLTSVGLDHAAQLGRTLGAIAAEKAGIIKPGVPCVSGATAEEARVVIASACAERGATLAQLGADFSYSSVPGRFSDGTLIPAGVSVVTQRRSWPVLEVPLPGEHQAANAAVAVAAVEELQARGFHIPDDDVARALARVRCPARVEIVGTQPLVVLDCCHNPAAAQALVATLVRSFPEHFGPHRPGSAKRTLVFGASRDKDLAEVLALLAPHFDAIHFTSYKRSRRSATEPELADAHRRANVGVPFAYFPNVAVAYRAALAGAGPDDAICVTGSVYLAGEFLAGRA
jgi:dihydrofolate synthase/folylpolyglutamate synthase